MPHCPNCQASLSTQRQREGLFYLCPGCHGRAVTIPQVRRVTGDAYATGLLRQINRDSQEGGRPCPFCSRRMQAFYSREPLLELDACKPCGVVWFDTQEFETVPAGAVESEHELHLRGLEAMARHRLEELHKARPTESLPEDSWMWVPAIFGFPLESETQPLRRYPWVTWGLAFAILGVSVAAFTHLDAVVGRWGFIPAEAFRWGGLTLLTSFFLHGGIWHLVGNLYFLLIFGDNVEDYIGRWRFGALILGSAIAGDLVHLLFDPGSDVPAIGASGGISGILLFYALRFPQARLGFLFRFSFDFRWIQIPAWGALAFWLGLQLLLLWFQWKGVGQVAATAHLGGALAGVGFWYWWRHHDCLKAVQ